MTVGIIVTMNPYSGQGRVQERDQEEPARVLWVCLRGHGCREGQEGCAYRQAGPEADQNLGQRIVAVISTRLAKRKNKKIRLALSLRQA